MNVEGNGKPLTVFDVTQVALTHFDSVPHYLSSDMHDEVINPIK